MRLRFAPAIGIALCFMLVFANVIFPFSRGIYVTMGSLPKDEANPLVTFNSLDETVKVETNLRVPNPQNLDKNIESAPSVTLLPNQTYDVQFEIPNSGDWAIVISRLSQPDSGAQWMKHKIWNLNRNSRPEKLVAAELGPDSKCLVTVWEKMGGINQKTGHPALMPFSKFTRSTSSDQGRNILRLILEFKFPDEPDIFKIIFSRPAA